MIVRFPAAALSGALLGVLLCTLLAACTVTKTDRGTYIADTSHQATSTDSPRVM